MIPFGGYDFALPGDGAAQCDALLAAFGNDPIRRVVLDAEVDGLDRDTVVLPFGRRALEWNPLVRPILYASTSFIIEHYTSDHDIAAVFDLWEAAYTAGYASITAPATPPPAPPLPFDHAIGWQFTSQYPSPLGPIDVSVFDRGAFAPGAPSSSEPVPTSEEDDSMEIVVSQIQGRQGWMAFLVVGALILSEPDEWATDVQGTGDIYGVPKAAVDWNSQPGRHFPYRFVDPPMLQRLLKANNRTA
jgi:hypothetical protein